MNTKIRVKKNLMILLIILIIVAFSVCVPLHAAEISEEETEEVSEEVSEEISVEVTEEVTELSGEELTEEITEENNELVVEIDENGNVTATPTRELTHDIDDIYIVLLFIMIILMFWMSADLLTKMVRIFLK